MKTTIKDFTAHHGLEINPGSIRKRLVRQGISIGVNDRLEAEVIAMLKNWYLDGQEDQPAPAPERKPEVKPEKKPEKLNGHQFKPAAKAKSKITLREVLALLPLPMLGLAASYGVFYFADYFVPAWVAIAEAAAFELTYIGLAALQGLTDKQRSYATKVSLGAVAVSIIYNSLAGALHQDPQILKNLPLVWFWIVAILHGAPLAILAYLVADLLFHRK